MLTNAMKEEKNSSVGLQIWISGMIESFLLLIFRKKICRSEEEFFRFIRTCKRRNAYV